MNRRWISKLSRAFCPALVVTLVFTAWASVQAAPLAWVITEGRIQGSTATAWLPELTVKPGDVVEYRLRVDVADIGAANSQAGGRTVTALTPGTDGFNSLFLAVGQAASDGILVDFPAAGTLAAGWSGAPGFSGGVPTPRMGEPTADDLTGVRPIRAAGDFAGIDPTDILQGTFVVGSADLGATGSVVASWNATGAGSLRINNGATTTFIQASHTTGTDPIVGFAPLALQAIPEPSTIALVGMGLVGLVALARRRRTA